MMVTRQIHKLATISRQLWLRLEGLWLCVLPLLTRDYFWVKVDGFRFYGSIHHQKSLYKLLKGSKEPFTRQLFNQVMKPGMVVLDIGANVGYYTLSAARRVGPQGKVYAFECDPRSYRFLLHNVKLNKCSKNVVPVSKAVAHQAGVVPFFLSGRSASLSSLWRKKEGWPFLDVECTTVDEILGNQQVHVIKMDIEGSEIHALHGMQKTLCNTDEVIMFVECNPSALSDAGGSVDILLAQLEGFGFRVQVIHEKERSLRPVSDEIYAARDARGKRNCVNLYCSKDGSHKVLSRVISKELRGYDRFSCSPA